MIDMLLAVLLSFVLSVILAPIVIKLTTKLKLGQNILHYVDNHKSKQGTPTMGGIFFVLAIVIASFTLFRGSMQMALVALSALFGFGVLGFLDDFIKIKFKRNMGLHAYQKIIGQLGISIAVAVFCYLNPYIGGTMYVPFVNITFDIGWWVIPFAVFILLAASNSTNLTDGLDGLAGGTTLVYLLSFSAIMVFLYGQIAESGASAEELQEYRNLLVFAGTIVGGLLGFLIFNSHPARIFMGDTGSLAIGGGIGCIALFSRQSLLLPIIGIMLVLSCISVILQVVWFKATKRRIFLMAPLHHHFERKGYAETKIVAVYMIVTAVVGVAAIMATLILFRG